MEADAFDYAVGCILSHTNPDGELHPVCYYSRKFIPAYLNYPIYDKELLAVVEAFKQWRVYLEGAKTPVSVYTDHKNLEYFDTARTASRRHARWASTLAACNYNIIYRRGAANGQSDALSRRADHRPPPLPSLPILPQPHAEPLLHTPYLVGAAVMVSPSDPLLPEIAAAEAGDSPLSATIKTILGRPGGGSNLALPNGSPSGRSEEAQFAFQGGILYHQGRILLPPTAAALILKILRQYHDSPLAGHYGVARTQALVGQYFKW